MTEVKGQVKKKIKKKLHTQSFDRHFYKVMQRKYLIQLKQHFKLKIMRWKDI